MTTFLFHFPYMKIKIILLVIISVILASCNTTNPNDVKKSDTQKIKSIKYGKIITSSPVKVKGEGSLIGSTTGGLIGGLLGTQVCGKGLIAGAKCEEIAIVYATWSGLGIFTIAILGYIFFKQTLAWQGILGLFLIVIGVILVNSFVVKLS